MGGTESYVRSLPNEYKYKNDWMEKHAEDVETLILGSSHSWFGINPRYIEGLTYNLGLPSQSLKYDNFLLKKWGERYYNLKMIIIPVSYFTFFFDEPFGLPQAPCYYKIYMGCPYHKGLSVYSFEMLFFKALHGKIVTLNNSDRKVLSDGYGWHDAPPDPKADTWDDIVSVRNMMRVQTGSLDVVNSNCNYLKDMVSFCRKKHIRMVLVSLPMWKTYNQALDAKYLAVMKQQIENFQQEYGIEYYDYREDNRFCESDFNDLNHLNAQGAEKFTKILATDIQIENSQIK